MGFFLDNFSGQSRKAVNPQGRFSGNQPRSFSLAGGAQNFTPFGGPTGELPEGFSGQDGRFIPPARGPARGLPFDHRQFLGDSNARFLGPPQEPDTVFDLFSASKAETRTGGREQTRVFDGNTKAGQGRAGGRQDIFANPEPTGYGPNGNFTLTEWLSMTQQQRDYLTIRGILEGLQAAPQTQPQPQPQATEPPIEAEFAPFDFTQQTTVPQFGVSGVPFGPRHSNATQGSTISTVSGGQSDLLNQILQAILSGGF